MQSSILFRFVVLSLFFSSFAWAKEESAKLAELDQNGEPVSNLIVSVLTATSKKLLLKETFGSPCPPGAMCILGFWERTREFRITRKSRDFCGSIHYRAEWSEKKLSAKMELVDHDKRRCMDLRTYRWDVTVSEADGKRRYFGGTPGIDPQKPKDCAEVTRDKMCTMQFMPATCSVSSINGNPLSQPVSATGGNPCQAEAALRGAACEKGLDWEAIREDEVVCSISVQACPMFMCVDPGPSCKLVPNNEVDQNGCATSCGDIVCTGGPDVAGD